MRATPRTGVGALAILLVAALAGAVSLGVRRASAVRVPASPEAGGAAAWTVTDPDSLYHARRLERALRDGGAVAPRDPLLAFPVFESQGGAAIPWPSGYTRLLHALVDVRPTSDPGARRLAIEQAVGTWPSVFAALTSGLAALVAGALVAARRPGRWLDAAAGALLAGLSHALCFGSLRYSFVGQGDHHAWVSLVTLALLGVTSWGMAAAGRGRTIAAGVLGLVAGLAAGMALVTWAASLLVLVVLQATFGAWILRARFERPNAAAAFVVGFHAAAFALVRPEVADSPWGGHEVVNLSTFHLVWIVLGGVLLLALLVELWPFARARRRPRALFALVVVMGLAGLLGTIGGGALGEIRAGFAWAGGATAFMGSITESQPLLGGPVGGVDALGKWLGWGVFAAPLAWLALARGAGARDLPWLAILPVVLTMALLQRRFAEGASAPLAVVLGAGYALAFGPTLGVVRRAPFLLVGALLLAVATNPSVARRAWERWSTGVEFVETRTAARQRALRELVERLRVPRDEPPTAVLAEWDLGHLIEWGAGRPTVATNFGDYIDCDAFLDPWLVLFGGDDATIEAVLARRRVGHVLVTDDPWRNFDAAERALAEAEAAPPAPASRRLVARLLPPGHPARSATALEPGYLRLVDEAQVVFDGRDEGAAAWVFEVVAGARIEAAGAPGETLEVEVRLRPPSGGVRTFVARAAVDESGTARVRVPYATDGPNGRVEALGPARWTLGTRRGEVEVTAAAVRAGERLRIESR